MSPYPLHARVLAALIALLAAASVVMNSYLGLLRHPDGGVLAEAWRSGRYFTILTTSIVALTFARVALTGRLSQGWAGGIALWCAIVGIVYHALLARELSGLRLWIDHGMHTAVPLGVAAWWLAFAAKDALNYRHALYWLGWPGLYMAYALLRGEVDGRHPYFFLDPPLIGWPKVLMWIPTLALVFWLAGMGQIWIAKRLSRGRPDRADAGPSGLQPR
ncbi:Pr6Pr family membrane protein [Tropicibacter sp. S64]|uniref:Pr6Pr family membrane protein n=1 Tax=Tropicibacter sp. S64 TaxID=3415122 RepID=UPI003C7A95B2